MDMPARLDRPAPQLEFTEDPLWYKDAVVYQLHVKSFFDGNNDGVGDFAGLTQKLDYIRELGVNTIWLLPFYPSPRRDDGYDIAAYKGVHPDYGTLADARRFIREAHKRGLRVITELVVNHTSDQHPWFQRARKAKAGSKARDFYVWSDTDTKYAGTRIIFCDTEKSNWTWDPVAKAYFWHRFYSHQPDLNFDNPAVLEAILGVLRYWLDMGVDGLRLDAVPYLIEREGTSNENNPETHEILKKIRAELEKKHKGRMLLAEANMWPEDVKPYFGDPDKGGDECHMAFHFPLMPRMYMALAQEDRFPITDILRQTPEIPPNCQWAIFLRNHDELTLEMVTDKERDYLWQHYASDKRARINLGIRKRLAPLLERDRRRIELLNSLLLSMPGTPVIYYGDEIGMGNNVFLGDRDGVRTPMQWSLDRNAGFSRADPASLVLPPLMDPLYGFGAINVESQLEDPHSLLNWMRRMLAVRKRHQAFGRGGFRLLYPANRRVLAYLREYEHEGRRQMILCVANVARTAQAVELDLSPHAGLVPVEMTGGSAFPPIGQLPYLLTLQPYGFYWFLLADRAALPAWHIRHPDPLPDLRTLVLRRDVTDILQPPLKGVLETEVLPAYLPVRRWYAAKNEKLQAIRVSSSAVLPGGSNPIVLLELEVRAGRRVDQYLLPVGFLAEAQVVSALPHQLALARARRGPRVGYLTDAVALDNLALDTVRLLRASARVPATDGEIRFEPTAQLASLPPQDRAEVRRLGAEQSNTSLVIGDTMILKLIRRTDAGIHPEAEMGRHLTAIGFTRIAQTLGEVARVGSDGAPRVLALLQRMIHNQGDAWSWSHNMLTRALQDSEAAAGAAQQSHLADFARFASTLGRRVGELHLALSRPTDDAAFAPEPADAPETEAWAEETCARVEMACELLERVGEWQRPEDREIAGRIVARRAALCRLARKWARAGIGSLRTRVHGDLHLAQVLVAQEDVYIIDFEGEPLVPLAERRRKTSPLRDVASMLRSFDYAAATAGGQGTPIALEDPSHRRTELLSGYLQASREAFLSAYREAASAVPHRWAGPGAERTLLDLFGLHKVAYEVAYEARNRPEWLTVPLQGLADYASRTDSDAS